MPSSDAESADESAGVAAVLVKPTPNNNNHHLLPPIPEKPRDTSGNGDRSAEAASSPPTSRTTTTRTSNSMVSAASWHEHVYAAPPRTPTPHRISDILGWSSNSLSGVRMQGKLLAPTPRRFTSGSPLVRAPLPIYSPLPAHSPASMNTVSIGFTL